MIIEFKIGFCMTVCIFVPDILGIKGVDFVAPDFGILRFYLVPLPFLHSVAIVETDSHY